MGHQPVMTIGFVDPSLLNLFLVSRIPTRDIATKARLRIRFLGQLRPFIIPPQEQGT
jgi:hypothetical protein